MNLKNVVLYCTESSLYFAKLIAMKLGIDVGHIERKSFGGVEKYYRIGLSSWGELTGKTAIFVGSTCTDDDILELYNVGCALADSSLQRIFVIPFFGYSTMERQKLAGEVVTAKNMCRLLSAIPNKGLGNTFLMMDLHVSGMVHYFEGNCQTIELYAEKLLLAGIRELNIDNFMFGSVDMGRSRWVQTFAEKFQTNIALIQKDRVGEKTKIVAVIGDVAGKNMIVYDDMTRSVGSMNDGGNAYIERGALEVYGVLSHFALNKPDLMKKVLASPFKKFVITNTHPMSELVEGIERFTVKDVSPIFVRAIQKIIGVPPIAID